ncbi:MAG: UDP-N-acetylmuramoyl-tripeptide--D-alanyl-D-alanine ligase [Planctomycetota bacterium]|jgi:UDP-N-acetylmuramoyl-tripeptide--D-alanyl-D-alanine ligase
MIELTVQDIKLAVGGEWARRPDDAEGREADDSTRALPVRIGKVCTDTRELLAGDVFLALQGANFDGSAFLEQAQQKGAKALVTSRLPENFTPDVPTIVVGDSLRAYGRIARYYRDQLAPCVVGITGSNGKTTTRELTAAVLRRKFQVLQNYANNNNRVGVPKTLLRMSELHDMAVIEMGTNEPGEIAELARIGGPQCAVLTSVSESHLSGLGSLEGVLREKSDLLAALPRDGIAIVNFDDPRCVKAAERANCRVVGYGTDSRCELFASDIRVNRYGCNFLLNGRHDFRIPMHGIHNVSNALAAIAVGWVSGVPVADMQLALRRIEPVGRRLEYRDYGDIGILDDSYNANPASTSAALQTLGSFECTGQRIAVLADMLELGDASERLHREVAYVGVEQPIDLVIAIGPEMAKAAEVFEEHFLKTGNGAVWRFDDSEQASKAIVAEARANDLLLLKGSNGMMLNEVIKAFELKFSPESGRVTRPTLREQPIGDPIPNIINKHKAAA